jgi:hypothetical protein
MPVFLKRLMVFIKKRLRGEDMFISFACPKETNQRKRQPQIFFGLNILSVAHALQLVVLRTPHTVMLTFSLRFATSKMLIYSQKRFEGITILAEILVKIFNVLKI